MIYRLSGSARAAEVDARVLNLVQDYLLYFGRWGDVTQLMLIVLNPSAATALANAVRLVAGVSSARIELVDELLDQPEEIGDYLATRLRQYVSAASGRTNGSVMGRAVPVGPDWFPRPGVVRSGRWPPSVFPR